MQGTQLDLSFSWVVDGRIGSGGFGRVYELTGGDQWAVAKVVPKASKADRELFFVGLEGLGNVVPPIDCEYQDNWVLVMPRADRSLRDHLTDQSTLPLHGVLAAEIVEELEVAWVQLSELAGSLPVDLSDGAEGARS